MADEAHAMSRDDIRKAIVSNSKPKSLTVEFFGTTIELRQPPMGKIFEFQSMGDRGKAAARMIIDYAYVPGKNEKVFDEADLNLILAMPFGADLARINKAIAELTDIDFEIGEAAKN